MNRYYESGNLIVRTDSFDTLKDLSQITQPKIKLLKIIQINGNLY